MRFAPALRFFRKSPAAVVEPDPADLGTAFGMEACLEEGGDFRPSQADSYELESTQRAARDSLESPLAWLSRRGT
ncbi:MAG: hypothetical protein C0423_05915 [Methylibium sp.]|nr:hypothetical protein [Methylibium sp.]